MLTKVYGLEREAILTKLVITIQETSNSARSMATVK